MVGTLEVGIHLDTPIRFMSKPVNKNSLLQSQKAIAEKTVLVCSFCGKVKSYSGHWADSIYQIPDVEQVYLKHDICPDCDHNFSY